LARRYQDLSIETPLTFDPSREEEEEEVRSYFREYLQKLSPDKHEDQETENDYAQPEELETSFPDTPDTGQRDSTILLTGI
jgi:hypothetical protein